MSNKVNVTSEGVEPIVSKKGNLINTIKIIVLAIVFGFLSGILGFIAIGLNGAGVPFFGKINFSDFNPDRQIIIDQPRNVIVDQDLQLTQIQNSLLPTLVNIYPTKKPAGLLSNAYLPSEILAQGFVLTSDGWIVAAGKVDLKSKYTAIGYQEKKYETANFIEDATTGIVFAKTKGNALPVATLGDSSQLAAGQTLIVINQRKNISFAHIKNIGYAFKVRADLVQSSEDLNKEIILDVALDDSYDGAALANFKGEIVGIVDGGRVVPINYFKNMVGLVLNGQKLVRPVLGINYVDLSHTEGLIDVAQNGAHVYGNPARTSPAFDKLKDADIIKKVDDKELNSFVSLSEAINNYKPGSRVYLTILRNKKERVVEIKLN